MKIPFGRRAGTGSGTASITDSIGERDDSPEVQQLVFASIAIPLLLYDPSDFKSRLENCSWFVVRIMHYTHRIRVYHDTTVYMKTMRTSIIIMLQPSCIFTSFPFVVHRCNMMIIAAVVFPSTGRARIRLNVQPLISCFS